jgi:hypothetical protein
MSIAASGGEPESGDMLLSGVAGFPSPHAITTIKLSATRMGEGS